jgi:hypothetical protein
MPASLGPDCRRYPMRAAKIIQMMDDATLRRSCAWSRQARNPRCTSSRSRAIYGRLVDTSGPYPRKYTGCVRHASDISSVALLVYAVNRLVAITRGRRSHDGRWLKPRLRAAPQSPPLRAAERAPTGHLVDSVLGNPRRRVSWRSAARPFRRGFNRPRLRQG